MLMNRLPRRWALALGSALGYLFGIVQWRRRRICYRNMDLLAGPGAFSAGEKPVLVRRMYRNLGKNLVEFFRVYRQSGTGWPDWIELEGESHLRAQAARGGSALFLLSHLGCWDLLVIIATAMRIPILIITKEFRSAALQKFWEKNRNNEMVQMIGKKNAAKPILQAIREGRSVGFIMDQNMNADHGVFVPVGHTVAGTLSAPAILARRFDLPVYALFAMRLPFDRYRIIATEPLAQIRTRDPHEDIRTNTRVFSDAVVQYILKYPDQWIWMHRRYKSRPDGEPSVYDF